MADSKAHNNLLAAAFPDFAIGLQPPLMQYQDGNVIIKFSDNLEDQLLLPQSILSDASMRFQIRFKSTNFAGGREMSYNGKKVTVFTYYLAMIDHTFCLTDEVSRTNSTPAASVHTDLYVGRFGANRAS